MANKFHIHFFYYNIT